MLYTPSRKKKRYRPIPTLSVLKLKIFEANFVHTVTDIIENKLRVLNWFSATLTLKYLLFLLVKELLANSVKRGIKNRVFCVQIIPWISRTTF